MTAAPAEREAGSTITGARERPHSIAASLLTACGPSSELAPDRSVAEKRPLP